MRNLDHEKTPRLPVWELIRREQEAAAAAVSSDLEVEVAAVSHAGRVRATNEDHYLALQIGRSMEAISTNLAPEELPRRIEQSAWVLLVADGIGGRRAGERASSRAISALIEVATRIPNWVLHLDKEYAADILTRAAAYFRHVDTLLEREADADPALAGMGTTLTSVCLVDRDLILTHVGDSRAYRLRDGVLRRLTHDQTMAQALADAGAIPESEVASHQQRHILTGALGAAPGAPEVQLGRHSIADGDRVLVASDGLTEMVPEAGIVSILGRNAGAAVAAEALLAAALDAGGADNVTVIVANCRLPKS
jgi:protein phosphatase